MTYKFPDVPPRCDAHGRSVLGQCVQMVKELKSYPELCKYFVGLFLCQNGCATAVLTIATNYLFNYLNVSSFQNIILFAVVLVLGTPSYTLFGCASKKFSYKAIWIFLCSVWIIFTILIPVIGRADQRRIQPRLHPFPRDHRPGARDRAAVVLRALLHRDAPADAEGQDRADFHLRPPVGLLVYPSIYTAMVQVDNNRQRRVATSTGPSSGCSASSGRLADRQAVLADRAATGGTTRKLYYIAMRSAADAEGQDRAVYAGFVSPLPRPPRRPAGVPVDLHRDGAGRQHLLHRHPAERARVALLAPWAFLPGLLCFLWVDWRKGMRRPPGWGAPRLPMGPSWWTWCTAAGERGVVIIVLDGGVGAGFEQQTHDGLVAVVRREDERRRAFVAR